MKILALASKRIFNDDDGHIKEIFRSIKDLGQSEEAYDDFCEAMSNLNKEAAYCVETSGKIRQGFSKWKALVVELWTASEQESGNTHTEARKALIEAASAEAEKAITEQNIENVKLEVSNLKDRLDKAEKRLDKATSDLPGPWQTLLMTAITSYTQALPSMVAAAIPLAVSASNPMAGLGMMNNLGKGPGQQQGQNPPYPNSQGYPAMPPSITDKAYDVATRVGPLLTTFYEFLGGATGNMDWSSSGSQRAQNPQQPSFFSDLTASEPSSRLISAIDLALEVAVSIGGALEAMNDVSRGSTSSSSEAAWKNKVKDARDTVLSMNAASNVQGGMSAPNPFTNLKVEIPKVDLSSQNAALNGAMQGVQTAQSALDLAQDKYDKALEKQGKTKSALVEIEKKLLALRESGRVLESIKTVLQDCISVLLDLSVQITRIEDFFIKLQIFINDVIQPRVARFEQKMAKAGERLQGALTISAINKQSIYMLTLQTKAYFSLLFDIAEMYNLVHHDHITPGLELMTELAKASKSGGDIGVAQAKLDKYTKASSTAVANLVISKHAELIKGLKARAASAQKTTIMLENRVSSLGIDTAETRKAIAQGVETVKEEVQQELANSNGWVVRLQDSGDADTW